MNLVESRAFPPLHRLPAALGLAAHTPPASLWHTEPEDQAQALPPVSACAAALAAGVIDQFDHGAMFLDAQARVLHANRIARRECADSDTLQLHQGRLLARRAVDAPRLHNALAGALRGLRTLLHFEEAHGLPVVLLPLVEAGWPAAAQTEGRGGPAPAMALLLMAKRSGTETLNIELFGRAHGLTPAENAVLKSLSLGLNPKELAHRHGVTLSTVRCQILVIRQKTGTSSIRDLLNRINNLPPVVCAV